MPMDQPIPHLRIQCGEKHVTPLCQALLPVLTGHGSAMFIPRYALGTMSEDKIKGHFQFHKKWARSLKAIPMSPQVNHLDQRRTEFNADGTTRERSAREWMSTIMAPDNSSPALCDVVNGHLDHKAYLLVPSHYLDVATRAWRHYKLSLYPPSHREASFCDNLLGLPDVIHIQAEMQAHVSFFEQLSAASVWQQAPTHTQPQFTGGSKNDDNGPTSLKFSDAHLLDPLGRPQRKIPKLLNPVVIITKLPVPPGRAADVDQQSASGHSSLGTKDGSTASTHSLTRASRTSVTTDTRFHEHEQSAQRKLHALEVSSKKSADQLLSMEHQLKRIDNLDQQVTAVSDKLDFATAQMKEANQTQQQMSVDMENIKTYTSQQFDVLNQRLLSNMESQHTMSATILDL
ncbi:hypothetical protein MHU86_788 [Fragilaria crotonensis]|nr:hypothetical protein MHU86_788 [Fragilaria crotonensis]